MPRMVLPVLAVPFGQGFILDDQKVFRVLFLGCSGEIEAPGNHGFVVYDHDLVMAMARETCILPCSSFSWIRKMNPQKTRPVEAGI